MAGGGSTAASDRASALWSIVCMLGAPPPNAAAANGIFRLHLDELPEPAEIVVGKGHLLFIRGVPGVERLGVILRRTWPETATRFFDRLHEARAQGRLLGEHLVAMAHIDRARVRAALLDQAATALGALLDLRGEGALRVEWQPAAELTVTSFTLDWASVYAAALPPLDAGSTELEALRPAVEACGAQVVHLRAHRGGYLPTHFAPDRVPLLDLISVARAADGALGPPPLDRVAPPPRLATYDGADGIALLMLARGPHALVARALDGAARARAHAAMTAAAQR